MSGPAAKFFDYVADRLAIHDLPRSTRPFKWTSLLTLGLLFAPGLVFILALGYLSHDSTRFTWFNHFSESPWQFWAIGLFGAIATLGGAGDWIFHKIYVSVGPREHHSHILALGAGVVVFILMAIASVMDRPVILLVPIVVALLTTTVLICYDEFAFHVRRCKPFETRLHRMLVFGNGLAFLCWMHWLFTVVPHG